MKKKYSLRQRVLMGTSIALAGALFAAVRLSSGPIQLQGSIVSGTTNRKIPEDVNGDGYVSPIDLQLLISAKNQFGKDPRKQNRDIKYWDVNGDGKFTSNDMLRVLSRLNAGSREGSGSGEPQPIRNASLPADVNGDGAVTLNDYLLLINSLSEIGRDPRTKNPGAKYYDVNGDGAFTANDVLMVQAAYQAQRR